MQDIVLLLDAFESAMESKTARRHWIAFWRRADRSAGTRRTNAVQRGAGFLKRKSNMDLEIDLHCIPPCGPVVMQLPPPPSWLGPTIASIVPNSGPAAGGTTVTITGRYFTGATAVRFGANAAIFTVDSDTQITAISPPLWTERQIGNSAQFGASTIKFQISDLALGAQPPKKPENADFRNLIRASRRISPSHLPTRPPGC
jgi:hypothetical protein